MPLIFVYKTLKNQKILEKALGEDHRKLMLDTRLQGWVEHDHIDPHTNEHWPNIWDIGEPKRGATRGEIFHVSEDEMAKLDDWEDHYYRVPVQTDAGKAQAYVLKEAKLSKPPPASR